MKSIIIFILGRFFPKLWTSYLYKRTFNVKLNWTNPKNLNEKIQYLKIYTDTSKWTELADKYKVRSYVENAGFKDNLVKLYAVWSSPKDISFAALPNSFVMKMNNGSGDVIVCKDKSQLDESYVKDHFTRLFKKKFGYNTAEPHYLNIHPCIIVEELLDSSQQSIKSDSLIDYKIWCFNGTPEAVWTCYNRNKQTVEVALYDLDWNYHPEFSVFTDHYIQAKQLIPRPKSLNKMLEIASSLSQGFPQARIDLYEVNGKPYFGEITFTSNYGMMEFYTPEYLNYLGDKVNI